MEQKKKIAGYHSIIKQQTPLIENDDLQHPQSSLNQYNQLFYSDDENKDSPNYCHQETVQTMYEKDLDSSTTIDIDRLGEQFGQSTPQLFVNNIDKLLYHMSHDNPNDYIDSLSNNGINEKELTLTLTKLKKFNTNLKEKINTIHNENVEKEMHMKTCIELDEQFEKLKQKNKTLKKQLKYANDYYKTRIESILVNQLMEYKKLTKEIKENNKSRQGFIEKKKERNNNNYDSRCDFEECWSITNQSNLSNHSIEKGKEREASNNTPYIVNSNSNGNTNNNINGNCNKRNEQLLLKSTRLNGRIVTNDLCNSNIMSNINKNSINHPNQMKYNIHSFTNKPNTNRITYSKKY